MQKKKKKELTFTVTKPPSKEAMDLYARFMYKLYMDGKIKFD